MQSREGFGNKDHSPGEKGTLNNDTGSREKEEREDKKRKQTEETSKINDFDST